MSDRTQYQQAYHQDYQDKRKRINLVVTHAEHRALSAGAQAVGMKLAAYVKRLAFAAHTGSAAELIPEDVLARLDELERLIRNVANNVNQMARHSNVIEEVLDEHEVLGHILTLENGLRQAVADVAAFGLSSASSPKARAADENENSGEG